VKVTVATAKFIYMIITVLLCSDSYWTWSAQMRGSSKDNLGCKPPVSSTKGAGDVYFSMLCMNK